MTRIVGIDLGTTNSELAYIRARQPVIARNGGDPMVPSVVGLDAEGRLIVGREAKNQYIAAPERTIRSIKRRMGTEDRVALGPRSLTPQEVSAMILARLRSIAEDELGESIDRAVITVPAYFNDAQRQATRDAGEIAGFQVERILNEPTAAALAYRCRRTDRETLLVYDLGGGTFDVSIVRADAEIAEVLASHGDTRLGGDDFDQLIVDLVADRFRTEHEVDLRGELRSLAALTRAAEAAKIALSSAPYTRLQVEFIAEKNGQPLHLDVELSRGTLEGLLRPRLDATLTSVRQALSDARLKPEDLDTVLLVGGSTRIPLVRELLTEHLGREPRSEVDPDLVVALGAATQAGIIAGDDIEAILVDITPHSLGIATEDFDRFGPGPNLFAPIIPRNTAIPVTRTQSFLTVAPGQAEAEIVVYQGESLDVEENQFLGKFTIDGLREERLHRNQILVRFDVDLSGMVHISAVEKETGRTERATIAASRSRLSVSDKTTAKAQLAELLEPPPQDPKNERIRALTRLLEQARTAERTASPERLLELDQASARLESLLESDTRDWVALDEAEEALADVLYDLM